VICGLLHSLYVVRVGGDFMHGRLFLPGLFGVLLPVLVVAPARWSRVALGRAGVAFAWSLVAGVALRERYPGYPIALRRFVDERAFYVASARNGHPVTVADYRPADQVRAGLFLRRRVGRHAVLELNPHLRPLGRDPRYATPSSSPSLRNRVVGAFFAVGLVSYSAGHRVTIVDRHGIADPIAARLEFRPQMGPQGHVWPVRYRAGHEKGLPLAWVVARYANLHSPTGRRLARVQAIAEARRALRCSRLRELLTAVDAPLTFDRFISNIGVAWRLRSFRVPPEPQHARRQLCG
jgi:arabinofuranosyltransferase